MQLKMPQFSTSKNSNKDTPPKRLLFDEDDDAPMEISSKNSYPPPSNKQKKQSTMDLFLDDDDDNRNMDLMIEVTNSENSRKIPEKNKEKLRKIRKIIIENSLKILSIKFLYLFIYRTMMMTL